MKVKKCHLKLIISITVFIILLLFACTIYLMYIPNELTEMRVYVGCATVDGTNIDFTDSSPRHSFIPRDGEEHGLYNQFGGSDLSMWIRVASLVTKCAVYSEAKNVPTDVQVAKICYYSSEKELETMLFAYDFHTGKRYALKNQKWYEVLFAPFLNSFINYHYDEALGINASVWRGQSTYTLRWDIPITDEERNQATFRYGLYWSPSERPDGIQEYQTTDFNINTARDVASGDQAIALAAEEMGYDDYLAIAYYDVVSGYWMVEIVDSRGFDGLMTSENIMYLSDNTYTLIISNQGLIKEKYQAITSTAPFWYN